MNGSSFYLPILKNISPPFSGSKIKPNNKSAEADGKLNYPPFTGFFFGVFFDPENGGDMFLRNVGLSPNYTALKPITPYSSQSTV
jgi:hypothetical protein